MDAAESTTQPPEHRRVEITDYTDYVAFMNDLIRYKRGADGFSYRVFCRKSGFRSPSYLKWVVDRVRPISLKSVHRFAAGLSLDRREAQYFTLMVNYGEAADPQTKRTYYEQMLAWRRRGADSLTKDAYEYLSHWYYVAIRELIAAPDFRDDPRWICERLGGDIPPADVKKGIEVLERLKLIRRDGTGRWRQASRDLHTEREVSSLAAFNYHTEMLELAQKVLVRRRAEERDFQSLAALIDRETFEGVKARMQVFRDELVAYLQQREAQNNNKRVPLELYAFNMQWLPLSAPRKAEI